VFFCVSIERVRVGIFRFVNRAGNLIRTAESEKGTPSSRFFADGAASRRCFLIARLLGDLHAERSAKVVYVGSGKCFEGDATNVAG